MKTFHFGVNNPLGLPYWFHICFSVGFQLMTGRRYWARQWALHEANQVWRVSERGRELTEEEAWADEAYRRYGFLTAKHNHDVQQMSPLERKAALARYEARCRDIIGE